MAKISEISDPLSLTIKLIEEGSDQIVYVKPRWEITLSGINPNRAYLLDLDLRETTSFYALLGGPNSSSGVYAYLAENFSPVYIGRTSHFANRMSQHASSLGGMEQHYIELGARILWIWPTEDYKAWEAQMIYCHQPPANKAQPRIRSFIATY